MSAHVGHLGQVGQVGQAGHSGQLVDGTAAAAATASFSRARLSTCGGGSGNRGVATRAAIVGLICMVADADADADADAGASAKCSIVRGTAIRTPMPINSISKNESSSVLIGVAALT